MDIKLLCTVLLSTDPPYVISVGSYAWPQIDKTYQLDPEILRGPLQAGGSDLFILDKRGAISNTAGMYKAFGSNEFTGYEMTNLDALNDVLRDPRDWGYTKDGCTVFINDPLPLMCNEPYTFLKLQDIFHSAAQVAATGGFPLKLLLNVHKHNLFGTGPPK